VTGYSKLVNGLEINVLKQGANMIAQEVIRI